MNGDGEIVSMSPPIVCFTLFEFLYLATIGATRLDGLMRNSLCAERGRLRFGIVYAVCLTGFFGPPAHWILIINDMHDFGIVYEYHQVVITRNL